MAKKNLGQRLLDIKEHLEEQKARRSELQGELKSIMAQLKEFGVDSLEHAAAKIKKEETELEKMEKTIRVQIEKLEEMMDDEQE